MIILIRSMGVDESSVERAVRRVAAYWMKSQMFGTSEPITNEEISIQWISYSRQVRHITRRRLTWTSRAYSGKSQPTSAPAGISQLPPWEEDPIGLAAWELWQEATGEVPPANKLAALRKSLGKNRRAFEKVAERKRKARAKQALEDERRMKKAFGAKAKGCLKAAKKLITRGRACGVDMTKYAPTEICKSLFDEDSFTDEMAQAD